MTKTYDLGHGCEFTTDNDYTINKIDAALTDLLAKAEANTDPGKNDFYARVKRDRAFATKRAVLYALNPPKKKEKQSK